MFDLQSPPNQDGRTCSTVFPVKGCFPESNKKVMTPMLQVLGHRVAQKWLQEDWGIPYTSIHYTPYRVFKLLQKRKNLGSYMDF